MVSVLNFEITAEVSSVCVLIAVLDMLLWSGAALNELAINRKGVKGDKEIPQLHVWRDHNYFKTTETGNGLNGRNKGPDETACQERQEDSPHGKPCVTFRIVFLY